MIAFSTCWNSRRHKAGDATLREIKTKLGFDLIELDDGFGPSLAAGIEKLLDSGEIRICSLTNIRGNSSSSSDYCDFAAPAAEQRERAITQAFQTVDLAAQLNAAFVLLRMGKVNMSAVTDPLIAMAKAGRYLSRKYVKMKINAVQERERIGSQCLQRVSECLLRVIDYASDKNVRIGLKVPRDYEQIPTERELSKLLEKMNSPYLGYWHDFGHCQVKENLGFIDHAQWLASVGPRTFGCHVHDCIWPAREGQLPFTAGVDFEKLIPLLPTNCLFVWQMNPGRSVDGIRRSLEMWKERFGE